MQYKIESATEFDLTDINRIISESVMEWNLSDRIKRLSIHSYKYDLESFTDMNIYIAQAAVSRTVGVGSICSWDKRDSSHQGNIALLHALYIDSSFQYIGIGCALLKHIEIQAYKMGYKHIAVKAQPNANGFFKKQGYHKTAVLADYPHGWLKSLSDNVPFKLQNRFRD